MGVAHGASDAVHLLPPHVYLQLLLGWGEYGLPGGTGCATVALSHIAATAAILGTRFVHPRLFASASPRKVWCEGKKLADLFSSGHGKIQPPLANLEMSRHRELIYTM